MKVLSLLKKIHINLLDKNGYITFLKSEGVQIGSGCDISKSANFGSEPYLISIGNNVRITKGVEFITHDGGIWPLRHMGLINNEAVKYGRIKIGDNCNISWNVIIMPNISIGKNCVIAAGAVVTKNVPEGTVWGGVPAKQIETIEEYYEKIKNQCVPTFSLKSKEKEMYLRKNCTDLFR